ncbi:MAG: hypothetical protein AAGJ92_09880 [Pseudomonadota bacterium]
MTHFHFDRRQKAILLVAASASLLLPGLLMAAVTGGATVTAGTMFGPLVTWITSEMQGSVGVAIGLMSAVVGGAAAIMTSNYRFLIGGLGLPIMMFMLPGMIGTAITATLSPELAALAAAAL